MLPQTQTELEIISPEKPKKLLEQMRDILRMKHYSIKTEETYLHWVKRFIFFHDKRHPKDMGAEEVAAFLRHLAVKLNVSASTQNQSFNAIIFLYRDVLKQKIGEIKNVPRAQRSRHIPAVMTPGEVKAVLNCLRGHYRLMGDLLYGTGTRLMELLRLRVKDIDFERNLVCVREGKGMKDRVTMLPASVKPVLERHLERVRIVHTNDLKNGLSTSRATVSLTHLLTNFD